jgi:hypothetical protein
MATVYAQQMRTKFKSAMNSITQKHIGAMLLECSLARRSAQLNERCGCQPVFSPGGSTLSFD